MPLARHGGGGDPAPLRRRPGLLPRALRRLLVEEGPSIQGNKHCSGKFAHFAEGANFSIFMASNFGS